MIIVKLANGNIELQNDSAEGEQSLQPNARLQLDESRGIIRVIYAQNNILSIQHSEVTALQIAPAAAVAFTGTIQELFNELKNNFFFELAPFELPYKSYVAYLFQIGTFDPVATVRENTLGGTLVWTRDAAGEYLGTLSGAFADFSKVFGLVHNQNSDLVYFNENDANSILVNTQSGTDGTLRAFIEIRIYD